MKEAYIYGCGQCGRDMYLKADLSIESRATDLSPESPAWLPEPASEPCEHCVAVIEQGDDEAVPLSTRTASSVGLSGHGNLITESVNILMDWCRCGNPGNVTAMAFLYLLTAVDNKVRSKDGQEVSGIPEEAWMLLSYICDFLGWTDHGGSVGGAWLTDTGKEALRRYTEKRESEEE